MDLFCAQLLLTLYRLSNVLAIECHKQKKNITFPPSLQSFFWKTTQQTFQRRFNVVFSLICRNVTQRQINVEIYNVEQRRTNIVHFKVDLNNVRQRRNNVAILT